MVELYVGLGAECHNSTRRSVGLHLGQFDTCQAQPKTAAAGSLVQLLREKRQREIKTQMHTRKNIGRGHTGASYTEVTLRPQNGQH